ncbi:MAG: hypothetical protein AAFS11_10595, partial [Planctomycetota bacterium]
SARGVPAGDRVVVEEGARGERRPDGALAAAGIPSLDDAGEGTGGVWTQPIGSQALPTELIVQGLGAAHSRLGASISANSSALAIGMPGGYDDCRQGATGTVRIVEHVGAGWERSHDIIPPVGVTGVEFGVALALGDRSLAVGMPSFIEPASGEARGAVFMYERAAGVWSHSQTLLGATNGSEFGVSLALDGDNLVVGQPSDSGSGSVVYYRREASGEWAMCGEASPPGMATGARFGASVSLRGGVLLAGAPHDNAEAGSVHHLTVEQGVITYQRAIAVPGVQPGARAGWSVAQNADHVFIAAPFSEPGSTSIGQGFVYVVPRNAGNFGIGHVLTDPLGSGARFGETVAASGSTLAVAARSSGTGAVRFFAFNGREYRLVGTATSPTGPSEGRFGAAIAVTSDTLAIGAPDESSTAVPNGGMAHLFGFELEYTVPECPAAVSEQRVQWIEDPQPDLSEWFAYSAEVSGGRAIVGVPFDEFVFDANGVPTGTRSAGKAQIYERTGFDEWTPVAAFRGNLLDVAAAPGANTDWLGWAVDIEGETAVAGGPQAIDEGRQQILPAV